MKRVFLQLTAGLFALGIAGTTACSSGGGGCGDGGASPAPTQLNCGRGTHQQGNACVANSKE